MLALSKKMDINKQQDFLFCYEPIKSVKIRKGAFDDWAPYLNVDPCDKNRDFYYSVLLIRHQVNIKINYTEARLYAVSIVVEMQVSPPPLPVILTQTYSIKQKKEMLAFIRQPL